MKKFLCNQIHKYELCHEKTCFLNTAQADQYLHFHCLDSIISQVCISKISRPELVAVAAHAGSETLKTAGVFVLKYEC